MAKRKELVQNRGQLANLMTKLEAGKSQTKVGDMRQALKILKNLDRECTKKGYKSILVMLRREVRDEVKAGK